MTRSLREEKKSMKPVYIMVGGFLGAGKTSTISRLARHYMSLGKKVGIVTKGTMGEPWGH